MNIAAVRSKKRTVLFNCHSRARSYKIASLPSIGTRIRHWKTQAEPVSLRSRAALYRSPFTRGEPFAKYTTTNMASHLEDQATAATLPKLSAQEFKQYNRMAEHMDAFHNHFRQTWNTLYRAASSGKRPQGMSIRQFLKMGEEFAHHLTMHHTIEEQHIFPVLAVRMPKFQKELQLLTQHKQIHAGLDGFEEYIAACKSGERELRMNELKATMDKFGKVLWQHLDDEVAQLGAENMRKFWTLDEMKSMPM